MRYTGGCPPIRPTELLPFDCTYDITHDITDGDITVGITYNADEDLATPRMRQHAGHPTATPRDEAEAVAAMDTPTDGPDSVAINMERCTRLNGRLASKPLPPHTRPVWMSLQEPSSSYAQDMFFRLVEPHLVSTDSLVY